MYGPNKQIAISVWLQKKELHYSINYKKEKVIYDSKLGIITNTDNYYKNLKWAGVTKPKLIKHSYKMVNAKKRFIEYIANEYIVKLRNNQDKLMEVVFSISNDGVAFRYRIPSISQPTIVLEESTTYNLPKKAKAWIQPMSVAKTGWEQCNPSYEEKYLMNINVGTPSTLAGWVYPALFKCNNKWLLISEADMDGRYCGTRLTNDSGSSIYKITFPDPREVFANEGYLPSYTSNMQSPWRILAIGDLKTIIQSTLGTDLAPMPDNSKDYSFVKPGKAAWSWINSKDDFIVYEEQKKYIDFAAQMNWKYCLIDADWDTKIGYNKVKELVEYAAHKNVDILLWYNSAGNWNTVKYHPKDLLLTKQDREKEFSRLQNMGVK
jgi:hypothetical protein